MGIDIEYMLLIYPLLPVTLCELLSGKHYLKSMQEVSKEPMPMHTNTPLQLFGDDIENLNWKTMGKNWEISKTQLVTSIVKQGQSSVISFVRTHKQHTCTQFSGMQRVTFHCCMLSTCTSDVTRYELTVLNS